MKQEVLPSEFDFFRPIPIQVAIEREYDEVVQPGAPITAGQPIQFTVAGSPDVYRDLSNTFLEVQCKVTNANDSVLADDAAVAPANLLLHTLFSRVEISICNAVITEKCEQYGYRAMIEKLLTNDRALLETRGRAEGWHPDEDAASIDSLLLAEAAGVKPNAAFVKRNSLIAGSRNCTLIGRLHASLFNQDLDIPPNCPMLITLTPHSNSFVLSAVATATYKFSIVSACLHVRSKKVIPDLVMAHRDALNTCNFRIPFTNVQLHHYAIPAQLSSHTVTNMFPGKLPKRIVVGLVLQARMNGAYNLNPYKFEPFGLKSIGITLNGQSIPAKPLEMNYARGDYMRAYLSALGALGLDIGNRSIALTPETWSSVFNLYAFKLQPGSIDDGPTEGAASTGTVDLTLSFTAGIAAPVELLVYSETGALLEITKLNEAILT